MRNHAWIVVSWIALAAGAVVADAPAEDASSVEPQAKALRDAGEPVEPADLKTWPTLPDERNAARIVAAASAALTPPTGASPFAGLSKRGFSQWVLPLTDADRQELTQLREKQAVVLAGLDALAMLDGYDWGDAPRSPLVAKREGFPSGVWPGAVAQLLYLDGLLAADAADGARTWRRAESLRRLGDGIASHPQFERAEFWRLFHERAAVVAGYAVAIDTFDDRAGGGRDALLAAVRRWLDERPARDALVREYQLQRVAIIDTHRRIADGTIVPPGGLTGGNHYHANQLLQQRIGLPMWPTVLDLYTSVIDTVRGEAALSYGPSYARHLEAMKRFAARDGVARYVATNLAPGFSSRHVSVAELRAHQVLTAAAVAVRLYRLDHAGAFPPSLDALVPKYLPAAPADPTASAEAGALAIRYRGDGPDPIVWACGPNGRDDAGRRPVKAVSIHEQWETADLTVPLRPAPPRPADD